jgi:pSer/pThr/pTyr-binding forkhead associated (FHA) protein
MAIKLIIRSLENISEEIICEQSLISFGRSKSCIVVLDHPEVSRRHFIIRYSEGAYMLIDEHSSCGTILDAIKIDPKNCYNLASHHEIKVPGFIIELFNDHKAPRQERTTVMARRLMSKLLDQSNDTDMVPRLYNTATHSIFYFNNYKTSFILGTLSYVDFVVTNDDHLAKEHISFVRDISGIKIIPIVSNQVSLNNKVITDPEILSHNDEIFIGESLFVYQDYQDDAALKARICQEKSPLKESVQNMPPKIKHIQDHALIRNLDRLCYVFLLVTALAMTYVVFNL